MSPPTAPARCPSCGTEFRAVLAPTSATQWFACPTCHQPVPVVPPRELPPLYAWEVVPGLYPPLAPLRPPRWRLARVAAVALAVAAALAAVSAGVLAYEAYVATEPAGYAVSGVVYQPARGTLDPVSGATVTLWSNGNVLAKDTTGPLGTFEFLNVPAGGIELNATAVGLGSSVVYTFASDSYSTQTRGLEVVLPGPAGGQTVTTLTPFGDLETLLAYTGGAAVLLGAAALVAVAGAVAVRRPEGATLGVIGSGAAVSVPLLLVLLSVSTAYPAAAIVAGIAGGAGGFALVLTTVEVASRPPPVEPGSAPV
jgi:hypothetical protein